MRKIHKEPCAEMWKLLHVFFLSLYFQILKIIAMKNIKKSVQQILHFPISHLLECVYCRLLFRQKLKKPLLIEATER